DLSFFDSAYTETQFQAQAEAAPTGFTEFVPFLAGEHTFGEAIFKSTLSAASTLTRPRMTQLVVAVDVPDVTDQGLMTIQTTGTNIVFAKSFFKVPSVKVVIKSGTALAIPRISNETTLGFTVKLESVSTPGTLWQGQSVGQQKDTEMQQFGLPVGGTLVKDSLLLLTQSITSVLSNSSGTSFPSTGLQVGQLCVRTDQGAKGRIYELSGYTEDVPPVPVWTLVFDLNLTATSKDTWTIRSPR
ncbi:hypothetical protein AN404_09720, partial [Pediococcus acidilactici]